MPLRILVVDDNIDTAETTKRFLKLKGYAAESAHSGESALAAISQFAPDVVLLDLGMPEMDGFQVAERLRGSDIVLVALTGHGQEEDRRRTAESGFAHHLLKPVHPDVLLTLLGHIRPCGHPEPTSRPRGGTLPPRTLMSSMHAMSSRRHSAS